MIADYKTNKVFDLTEFYNERLNTDDILTIKVLDEFKKLASKKDRLIFEMVFVNMRLTKEEACEKFKLELDEITAILARSVILIYNLYLEQEKRFKGQIMDTMDLLLYRYRDIKREIELQTLESGGSGYYEKVKTSVRNNVEINLINKLSNKEYQTKVHCITCIDRLLDSLTLEEREILILRYMNRWSIKEISKRLNISEKKIENIIEVQKGKLKALLNKNS